MDSAEKSDWRQHLNDQWKHWATVLDRIKEDEHRWVLVLLAVLGALLFFLTTILDDKLRIEGFFEAFFVISFVFLVLHGFAWLWSRHALILRIQYYRSVFELHMVEKEMGKPIDKLWLGDDRKMNRQEIKSTFHEWRRSATKPNESKLAELLLVSGMVFVCGVIAMYRLNRFFICLNTFWELSLFLYGTALSILGIFWPICYYRRKDIALLWKLFLRIRSS